jgi:Cytochrome P460
VRRKNGAMRTGNVVTIGIAGTAAVIAVAAYGQQNTAASNNDPAAETVVDANGNLHVPEAYRTTYQALGTWAVAAGRGKGSKELHVVYASPGTITAYRESGHFPDGAVLVKEVLDATTGKMKTGTVSRVSGDINPIRGSCRHVAWLTICLVIGRRCV